MEPSGLADTTAQVRNTFRITSAVARGLRESAIIALGVVALVVFTALVSYSPDDPGFSFTGNSSVVHNRIGPIGAWVADVLFFLFGRPAFLFPVMLGGACWLLFRRDKAEQTSKLNTAVRIAGFVLVLVTSCGLVTLHWDAGSLRQTAGGVVGSLVGKGLASGC
jgi:S-DNA-T family DNA segregation ATPase FtsK/SpoIIIE